MVTTLRNRLQPRWAVHGGAFLLWALAALSLGYWALRLSAGSSLPAAVVPAASAPASADPTAIARLLGSAPVAAAAAAAPSLASRFVLTGVVAGTSGGGAALIATDGRPPRPYRVGSQVDDGLVLQSVQGRRALLGPDPKAPASLTLELPPLPR